jgi:hypothetical protein
MATSDWLTANQRYLTAALHEVRAQVERRPGAGAGGPTAGGPVRAGPGSRGGTCRRRRPWKPSAASSGCRPFERGLVAVMRRC